MYRYTLNFGIDDATGHPYVEARHGRVMFASVDAAATFAERRARTLLDAYLAVWTSVDEDIAALEGELVNAGADYAGLADFPATPADDDIPF